MEDDEEDSPLSSKQLEIEDTASRENIPLIHTRQRCRISGSVPNTVGSLHGAMGLGFVSIPSDSAEYPQTLLHGLNFHPGGDAEFVPHCPAVAEELGEEEQQDEGKMEEEEEEDQERMSVEVQIGRKLRQIGDQFQEEHMQLFVQYQRDQLPMWWHLTIRLYNFLFVREAFHPGGGH